MEGKIINNQNHLNMKNEFEKKIKKKLFNIVKSSKKPNSKISIFSPKSINITEDRKNKNNKMILNLEKNHQKEIITEKVEKIPKSSSNHKNDKINIKNDKKNKIKSGNNDNNHQNTKDQKNNKNSINDKILSFKSKKYKNFSKSFSISNNQLIYDYSETDVVTSYEKNTSELKTPKTISEGSFLSIKENKSNNETNEIKENDLEEKKLKNIFNKKQSENIKVNIKSIEKNKNDYKNIKNEEILKFLNSSNKMNKIKIKDDSNLVMLCKSNNLINTKNINKLKLNNNKKNSKYFINNIQNSITVKKKQNTDLCDINKNDNMEKSSLIKNIRNKSENKDKSFQEIKKHCSYQNIKFRLNQKLAKMKKNKNIPINKNKNTNTKLENDKNGIKDMKEENNCKIDSRDIILTNINENKEKTKNNKIKNENAFFKLNERLRKKIGMNKKVLDNNTNIKLIKDKINNNKKKKIISNNNNNHDIYNFKKNSNIITKTNNTKLSLNIDNSNGLINNCMKLSTNKSVNNIIYAPKKGFNRIRSHEKKNKNLYNNMSYKSNKLNGILENGKNSKLNNDKFIAQESEHYLEKNKSFCGVCDRIEQIEIENKNNLNSPRINLRNNIPKTNFNIINDENKNFNYFKKISEQELEDNNNMFIHNRLTTNEKINYNCFFPGQNINNLFNTGIKLNTDSNNYDINNMNNFNNILNNRAFINERNFFPQGYSVAIISPFNNNINQTNLINLFNNNYLNFNTIQGRSDSGSFINYSNYKLNESPYHKPNEEIKKNNNNLKKSSSINIGDIIILQEKLKYIISALNKAQTTSNECFEFLNFYYNSSINCQLEKVFSNPIDSNIVRISINCILITIIICYDYSFEREILNKVYMILLNLIKLNYKNLIIIYEHILSKISIESKNNIWVKKLENIINSYKKIEPTKINNLSKITIINNNTNTIFQNLLLILENYRTYQNEYLLNFISNISDKSYSQINIFFREYILRTINLNGSILASVYLRTGIKNFVPVPNPYVRTKNSKNYSLVLDLDETLIHFKENFSMHSNGVLRIRPGLSEFLEDVGKYYELIVFTTATQDYADALIDAIEDNKIYFEHRFYRNHAIIINNDFVKDLTRIGRPLDKIIIVDNMPQNFRLQKENGIMIKAFWGEDHFDTALFDLNKILVNIAKEGGDIRKGLVKYKDDILKKVSSTISKENI